MCTKSKSAKRYSSLYSHAKVRKKSVFGVSYCIDVWSVQEKMLGGRWGCAKFGCVLLEVARRSNRDGISTVAGRCVAKKRCRRDTVEKQFLLEEHRWYFGVY